MKVELSQLELDFGISILKDTQNFEMRIKDISKLKGLPEDVLKRGKKQAEEAGHSEEFLFKLDTPTYISFMDFADDSELRKKMYMARGKIATQGEYNNLERIRKIVNLRRQVANLMDCKTYADFVFAKTYV